MARFEKKKNKDAVLPAPGDAAGPTLSGVKPLMASKNSQENKKNEKIQKASENTGSHAAAVAFAQHIDREALPAKTRLYTLAKQLGIASREIVTEFSKLGVKKAAQSSVSKQEVVLLLDSLGASAPAEDKQEQPEKKSKKPATKPRRKATTKAATKAAEKPKKATKKSKAVAPELAPSVEETPAAVQDNADEVADVAGAAGGEAGKPAKKTTRKAGRKATRKAVRKSSSAKKDKEAVAEVKRGEDEKAEHSENLAPLAANADVSAKSAGEEDEQEAKLRTRVRKNVENEIAQIEEKVDSQLADTVENPEHSGANSEGSAESSQDAAQSAETVADAQAAEDVVAQLQEALEEAGDQSHDFDDLGEDYRPIITPKPATDSQTYELAPVFMPPHVQPASASVPEFTGEDDSEEEEAKGSRRRGRRGTSRGRGSQEHAAKATSGAGAEGDEVEEDLIEEPKAIKGSTRIEAQRRRRAELREKGRERQHIVSQAEFLARRESVERTMVVRDKQRKDGAGVVTQVGVLEDDLLVEHFVTSESQTSLIGNIYLGRVQNVLPSMEAAFVDIGQGRNGVLYAGEVDWRSTKLGGRARRIENALKSGDQVLVQVAKDPIGHKGARLTTQISLAGRYLVYVPGGRSAGISRKLPAPERKRLKSILENVIPGRGGAIIRTAAENVPEDAIAADVRRLNNTWQDITERANEEKSSKGAKPVTLYEEPDVLVKVVRDLFNEDFHQLVVDGTRSYNVVRAYVDSMAPDLADRVVQYRAVEHGGMDAFETYRIDEQLHKALSRKVWLPSGGTLIIDRTEAMTVIDVNTGKFTGSGGNLEETVTRNNLEAAEEIVRQMRLRDIGGMIVVDFIDMVLPENQDLVLRRLKETLERDRTRHQVSEVTSLGLVQMTRKRLGTGLIETFATECEHCHGRGLIIHEYPVDEIAEEEHNDHASRHPKKSHQHKSEKKLEGEDTQQRNSRQRHSIEDLVANVIVDDEEDSDASHTEGDKNAGDGQRSKRRAQRSRRGRRGHDELHHDEPRHHESRHEGSEHTSAAEDIASIGYAAAENAAAQDEVAEFNSYVADEPAGESADDSSRRSSARRSRRTSRRGVSSAQRSASAQEHAKATEAEEKTLKKAKAQPKAEAEGASRMTFAQAQAEFEASPRRKRATRGNSRSDHAPRPEDYADSVADEVAGATHSTEQAQTAQSVQAAQPAEAAQAEPAAAQPARTRGRRRAVRNTSKRASHKQAAAATVKAQPKKQSAPAEENSEAASAAGAGAETKVIRRGRKRAVRKVTAVRQAPRSAEKKEQAPVKESAAESREESAAPNRGNGRGRRRLARRRSK
ncbi:translation initiation factor IF-2 N-terminal domain-containing protein [Corynebacterium flavescens]